MRTFHTGGVANAGKGSNLVGSLDRVTQLVKMPKNLPGAAVLAPDSGKVSSIKSSPAGGWDVSVGSKTVHVPGSRELRVKKGDQIRRGMRLSSGPINPIDLLDKTDINTVQRYISEEMHNVYGSQGITRRNLEVVTRTLTNLSRVDDPGSADGILRGDMISTSLARSLSDKGVKFTPIMRGVETLPLDRSRDWGDRLLYRRLRDTIKKGANQGWKSDIHGLSPIPGIMLSAELGKPPKGSKGPY